NAAGAVQQAGIEHYTLTIQGYYQQPDAEGRIRLGFVTPNSYERDKLRRNLLTWENLLSGPTRPAGNSNKDSIYRCDTLPEKMTGYDFEIFQEWNDDVWPHFVLDQQNAA